MSTLRVITFGRSLPVLAAEAQGYFATEGLTIEWELTRGSIEQIRGLLDGRWDIAHTAADNVMAWVDRDNVDLFVFLVGEIGGLDLKLVVRPDIQSYADLRGEALAVDAPDTGFAFILRKMLTRNGLKEGDYGWVPVGATQQRLDSLLAGQTAGGLMGALHTDLALAKGYRVLDSADRYFPIYPGLTAATTRRWASVHDAELLGYTRALLAGVRWAADPNHREEAIALIAQEQHLGPATVRQRYEAERSSRVGGIPDIRQIETSLEVVRQLRHEMTGVGRDLSAYFDPAYMQRALAP